MGRPDQGNKAQTPVGYSHGTGVSTGGLATAVPGVDARVTPGVHVFVWGAGDVVAGATEYALRCPQGVLLGVAGSACRPRERRRSGDVCVEECEGVVVRWIVWRAYLRRYGGLGGVLTRGTQSSR